jgi:hypothetical protein
VSDIQRIEPNPDFVRLYGAAKDIFGMCDVIVHHRAEWHDTTLWLADRIRAELADAILAVENPRYELRVKP